MMFNKHFVSQYNLQQGDKITILAMPVEDTSNDLQLSRSPRAAAVKAEAMTLMQQLQQSLREIKHTQKEQQHKALQNTENCETIQSQGSYEEDHSSDYASGGGLDEEQGSAGGTPRPSIGFEDSPGNTPIKPNPNRVAYADR